MSKGMVQMFFGIQQACYHDYFPEEPVPMPEHLLSEDAVNYVLGNQIPSTGIPTRLEKSEVRNTETKSNMRTFSESEEKCKPVCFTLSFFNQVQKKPESGPAKQHL